MTVPHQAIPNGWFVVATTKELPAGRIVERIGAHLGSGQVVHDRLRCPFHGLPFARDGRCVASADGRRPPSARLDTRPLREPAGLVLAYWHAERTPPDWEVPDLAHFGPTHGYAKPRFTSPPSIEGPVMRTSYAVERELLVRGYEHDLSADVPIWRKKRRYEPRPALMEGKRAIVVHRRFAERFYSPPVPISERSTSPQRQGADPRSSRCQASRRSFH